MEKPKNVPYRMTVEEHTELKLFCVKHGYSLQEFVTKAVEEYRKKWVV